MGNLVFQATLGGQVNLVGPNTASTYNLNVPAVAGTLVTTGDTGTVTNTMCATSVYTAPGTIGSGTPNSGAFTTLSASSTVSGTGFSTYLASPPAIGGTAPAAVTGSNLMSSGGMWAKSTYSGTTYSDGVVIDYTTGLGRISVGTSDGLAFYNAGVATTELMRLDSSGNLGIGTSSPAAKLHVAGSSATDFNALTLRNGDGTTGSAAVLGFEASSGTLGDVASLAGQIKGIRTGSGTSGALAFWTNNAGTPSERMRIDSSGNVGIGTSSISSIGAGYTTVAISNSTGGGISYQIGSTLGGQAYVNAGGMTYTAEGATYHRWYTNSSERMRIDSSGNLLVGTANGGTQNANSMQYLVSNAQGYVTHVNGTGSGTGYWIFSYNGSTIGSITQNGTTGVLYNLTSDYRLKNDPQPLTGAKEFVMALQPKTWDWWDGSGKGVGFIAHEFMEVAKYSGHGEKDAVDDDGNPVYQSIQPSSSEVMANLVAFIQEQQAIIQQLQADVTALKAPQ